MLRAQTFASCGVLAERIELSCPFERRLLRPLCLPFHHASVSSHGPDSTATRAGIFRLLDFGQDSTERADSCHLIHSLHVGRHSAPLLTRCSAKPDWQRGSAEDLAADLDALTQSILVGEFRLQARTFSKIEIALHLQIVGKRLEVLAIPNQELAVDDEVLG